MIKEMLFMAIAVKYWHKRGNFDQLHLLSFDFFHGYFCPKMYLRQFIEDQAQDCRSCGSLVRQYCKLVAIKCRWGGPSFSKYHIPIDRAVNLEPPNVFIRAIAKLSSKGVTNGIHEANTWPTLQIIPINSQAISFLFPPARNCLIVPLREFTLVRFHHSFSLRSLTNLSRVNLWSTSSFFAFF